MNQIFDDILIAYHNERTRLWELIEIAIDNHDDDKLKTLHDSELQLFYFVKHIRQKGTPNMFSIQTPPR